MSYLKVLRKIKCSEKGSVLTLFVEVDPQMDAS